VCNIRGAGFRCDRKEYKRKEKKRKEKKKKKKVTTLCVGAREQGLPPPVLQGMLVSPRVQPSVLLLGFDTPTAFPKSEKTSCFCLLLQCSVGFPSARP